MAELELCPFCGGKAIYESEVEVIKIQDKTGTCIDAETFYHEKTGCPVCDIWFFINEDEVEKTTIKKWNRRADNANN